MDLGKYQEWTESTAIYPERLKMGGLMYATLGFVGEFMEYRRVPSKAELGDAYWYLAEVATHLGVSLEETDSTRMEILDRLHGKNTDDRIGDLAGAVKKMHRDGSVEAFNMAQGAVEELLFDLNHIAEVNHAGVGSVLKYNRNKLESRKARGVLKGSGDER